MDLRRRAARFGLRAARSIARRTGDTERLTELEAVFNGPLRRDLRDSLATQAVLAAVLRPDSHAIDVGASTGGVLRHMIRLAPQGKYVAYEPIPRLAHELADRFPQVAVRQVALSDEPGSSTFHHVVDQSAYSGLRLRTDIPGPPGRVEEITVQVCRLDDDLPDGFRPDVIKVDVEGAEVKMFRGAVETLRRFQPVLVFEHGRSDLYETTSDELWDMLTDCGYRIFNAEGEGPYSRDQFRTPAPEWNYMAIPRLRTKPSARS